MSALSIVVLSTVLFLLSAASVSAQHQANKAPGSVAKEASTSVRDEVKRDAGSRLAVPSAQAQSRQEDGSAQTNEVRPHLRNGETAKTRDEFARADEGYVIFRSGEKISLPLTPGAPLRLALDAGISTSRMNEGVTITRLLPIRTAFETPYQGIYAEKDYLVETQFSGRHSGFKNRSILMINPKQFQVEVGPTDYLVVGKLDDFYIVLKPGKWRFDLECSLKQVVTPEGETWTARNNQESNEIRGQRFGREAKVQNGEDLYSGLAYFPRGELAYGISQLKGLWRFLVHRPNLVLPTMTDLYFQVDRMTATYLGPSVPTGPATIVK